MPGADAVEAPDRPDLDAIRTCTHCGICLPQCPTYRMLGEEMDSPRGRVYLMRAVAEGRASITETFTRHLDRCLGCRACETACPAGVPFGSLLEATRAQIERGGRPRPERWFRALVFALFPHPHRLGAALRLLGLYRRSGVQSVVRSLGLLRRLPRLAAMDALLGDVPASSALPELVPAVGTARGRVGLVLGCVQRHLYPSVNRDTARLLSLAGWNVVVPARQECCGALSLHAGRLDEFRHRAQTLAGMFPSDLDHVVSNAAGCGSAIREYGHWLPGAPEAIRLAERTRDVTELLADADLPLGRLELTVTYHEPCHLAHGQRVRSAPRALLGRIPGLTLLELAESDVCCGSAGIYNLLEPGLAGTLLQRKVSRIAETGAQVVATGNPGCLLQIANGCRARGLDVEVVHPVELVARAVRSAR